MAWSKREPVSNLVVLGDDEGQVKKVGGLLASVKQDAQYPSRSNYELIQKDGESIMLAGSASIGRQLFPGDIGRFVKLTFMGWGSSKNGKFKEIEVNVFDGEPTDDMKKWPRYAELSRKPKGESADGDPGPTDTGDDFDDDLPF